MCIIIIIFSGFLQFQFLCNAISTFLRNVTHATFLTISVPSNGAIQKYCVNSRDTHNGPPINFSHFSFASESKQSFIAFIYQGGYRFFQECSFKSLILGNNSETSRTPPIARKWVPMNRSLPFSHQTHFRLSYFEI